LSVGAAQLAALFSQAIYQCDHQTSLTSGTLLEKTHKP
jgi:hypothetical protein